MTTTRTGTTDYVHVRTAALDSRTNDDDARNRCRRRRHSRRRPCRRWWWNGGLPLLRRRHPADEAAAAVVHYYWTPFPRTARAAAATPRLCPMVKPAVTSVLGGGIRRSRAYKSMCVYCGAYVYRQSLLLLVSEAEIIFHVVLRHPAQSLLLTTAPGTPLDHCMLWAPRTLHLRRPSRSVLPRRAAASDPCHLAPQPLHRLSASLLGTRSPALFFLTPSLRVSLYIRVRGRI